MGIIDFLKLNKEYYGTGTAYTVKHSKSTYENPKRDKDEKKYILKALAQEDLDKLRKIVHLLSINKIN